MYVYRTKCSYFGKKRKTHPLLIFLFLHQTCQLQSLPLSWQAKRQAHVTSSFAPCLLPLATIADAHRLYFVSPCADCLPTQEQEKKKAQGEKASLARFAFLAPTWPATIPTLVVASKEASARHKLLCSLSPSSCHYSGRTSTLLRKSVCRLFTHPRARKEESVSA